MNKSIALASLVAGLVAVSCAARGQFPCPEPEWKAFDPSTASYPGTNDSVGSSTMWDPDGPGPIEPRLVIIGDFTVAGSAIANQVAVYEPVSRSWSTLGDGLDVTTVNHIVARPQGDLIAAIWKIPEHYLMRWDGTAWVPLGPKLDYQVYALAAMPDGDIVAGGAFSKAGNVTAAKIARLDVATGQWSAYGTGMPTTNDQVACLAVMPNNDIVAGGVFATAGGVTVNHIARWSESAGQWSPLGSGLTKKPYFGVSEIFVLPGGDLIVGGQFEIAGGVAANNIARWSDTTGQWSALGPGLTGPVSWSSVRTIVLKPNGDLFAGGYFESAGGTPVICTARWDGSTWSALGTGIGGTSRWVNSLSLLPDGDVVACGKFPSAGGVDALNIARWSDATATWSPMSVGFNGGVSAIASSSSSDEVLVAGSFTNVGGASANRIARWAPKTGGWVPLGTGVNDLVRAAVELPNGDLVAGGDFIEAGGVPVSRIARWSASTSAWDGMNAGIGGVDNLAVHALAELPNGELIVGGHFSTAGGVTASRIARWNSVTGQWSPLGLGIGGTVPAPLAVFALAVGSTGDVIAGGQFTKAGGQPAIRIARYEGSGGSGVWSAFGSGLNGSVYAVAALPNGDVVAGGEIYQAGGVAVNSIALWKASAGGGAWTALGAGITAPNYFPKVLAMLPLANGDLIASGSFEKAGGVTAKSIARWDAKAASWSSMDTGVGPYGGVLALSMTPSGDLLAGGGFVTAGSALAPFLARYGCPTPPCLADCDQSGTLNVDDFVCFQTLYAIGDPKADCDQSGALDIDDFVCFQTLFAIGC